MALMVKTRLNYPEPTLILLVHHLILERKFVVSFSEGEFLRRLSKAQHYLESGKFSRTQDICEKLLKKNIRQSDVRLLLAKSLIIQEKPARALAQLKSVLDENPDNPAINMLAGDVAVTAQDYEYAVQRFQFLVQSDPANVIYWRKLLNCLYQAGESELLLSLAESCVAQFPKDAIIICMLGHAALAKGNKDLAFATYELCFGKEPFCIEAHRSWLELKIKTAINDKDNVESANAIVFELSTELYRNVFFKEVIVHYEQFGDLLLDDIKCVDAMSVAIARSGRWDDALRLHEVQIIDDPENEHYHAAMGLAHYNRGEFEISLAAYDKAVAIDPANQTIRWNRSFTNMQAGNLQAAYTDMDCKFSSLQVNVVPRTFTKPAWKGEDLSGKILYIWAEQGVGDVYRHLGIFDDAKSQADKIILEVQAKKLIPVLSEFFPDTEIRMRPTRLMNTMSIRNNNFEEIEKEDFDYQISVGSTTKYLRPDMASFDKKHIYSVGQDVLDRVRNFHPLLSDNQRPKIGLAWTTKSRSLKIEHDYLFLDDFEEIVAGIDADFFNLQYKVRADVLTSFETKTGVKINTIDEIDLFEDLLELTALTELMDGVIVPDTTSGSIAGALGVESFRYGKDYSGISMRQEYIPWFASQKFHGYAYNADPRIILPEMRSWLIDLVGRHGKR